MAGYGKIILGQKQAATAKSRGDYRGIMGAFARDRAGSQAKMDIINTGTQALTSMWVGYKEGQSKWKNIETGGKELGVEGDVATARSDSSWVERAFGPSEKTLEKMATGPSGTEGKDLNISLGELGTMGKIKKEAGSRFIKTYDTRKGEYRDVKDSGWGELIDNEKAPMVESTDAGAGKDAPPMGGENDASNADNLTGTSELTSGIDNYGEGSATTALTEAAPSDKSVNENSSPKNAITSFGWGDNMLGLDTGQSLEQNVQKESFDNIFARERKKQGAGGSFIWGGNPYSTNYAEDF